MQRGTVAHIKETSKTAPEPIPKATFCEMIKNKLLEVWNYLKRFFCWRSEGEPVREVFVPNSPSQPFLHESTSQNVAALAPIDRLSLADKQTLEAYVASRMEKENSKSASLSPEALKGQIHMILDSLVKEQIRLRGRLNFPVFESQRKSMEDTILAMQVIPALVAETQKMRNAPGKPTERASGASQQAVRAYIKRCVEIEGSVGKSSEELHARQNEIEEEMNYTIHQAFLQVKPVGLEQLTPLAHQEKTENHFLTQKLIPFLPLEIKIMERIEGLQSLGREINNLKEAVDRFMPSLDGEALGPYKTYQKAQTLLETTNRTDALAGSEMKNTVTLLDGIIEEMRKIQIDKEAYLQTINSYCQKTELTLRVKLQIATYARELDSWKNRFNDQKTIIADSKAMIENFYRNLEASEKGYLRVLRSTEEAVTSKIESINKLVGKSSYAYTSREGHARTMETQVALQFQEVHDEYQACYEFFEQHKNIGYFSRLVFGSTSPLVKELTTRRDALKKRLAAEERLAEKERLAKEARLEKEKQEAAQQKALAAALTQTVVTVVPPTENAVKKEKGLLKTLSRMTQVAAIFGKGKAMSTEQERESSGADSSAPYVISTAIPANIPSDFFLFPQKSPEPSSKVNWSIINGSDYPDMNDID